LSAPGRASGENPGGAQAGAAGDHGAMWEHGGGLQAADVHEHKDAAADVDIEVPAKRTLPSRMRQPSKQPKDACWAQ
jgi:hypothetical protein